MYFKFEVGRSIAARGSFVLGRCPPHEADGIQIATIDENYVCGLRLILITLGIKRLYCM